MNFRRPHRERWLLVQKRVRVRAGLEEIQVGHRGKERFEPVSDRAGELAAGQGRPLPESLRHRQGARRQRIGGHALQGLSGPGEVPGVSPGVGNDGERRIPGGFGHHLEALISPHGPLAHDVPGPDRAGDGADAQDRAGTLAKDEARHRRQLDAELDHVLENGFPRLDSIGAGPAQVHVPGHDRRLDPRGRGIQQQEWRGSRTELSKACHGPQKRPANPGGQARTQKAPVRTENPNFQRVRFGH